MQDGCNDVGIHPGAAELRHLGRSEVRECVVEQRVLVAFPLSRGPVRLVTVVNAPAGDLCDVTEANFIHPALQSLDQLRASHRTTVEKVLVDLVGEQDFKIGIALSPVTRHRVEWPIMSDPAARPAQVAVRVFDHEFETDAIGPRAACAEFTLSVP